MEDSGCVSIILSQRKNRAFESKITRSCWCSILKVKCGTCILKDIVNNNDNDDSDFIFPQNSAKLTNILKFVASKEGVTNATWHGIRRGRTVDLIRMRDRFGRPLVSLAEIFESGQWAFGSRAVLNYIQEGDMDASKLVVMVADNSDSE